MDIMRPSGRRAGPATTAQLRFKADEATIAKSLQGHEHIFELTQAQLYRVYQAKIAECDLKPSWNGLRTAATVCVNGKKPHQGNAPRFDVRTHLYR